MPIAIQRFGPGCVRHDPFQAKGRLSQDSVSGFLQTMNLAGQDPDEHFNPSQDDIGDWFQGTPEWVRRS